MLVHNRNLFPLVLIHQALHGYYFSKEGQLFSERARKDTLVELKGAHTPSGHYFSLANQSFRQDLLFRKAQTHERFYAETRDPVTQEQARSVLDEIRARSHEKRETDNRAYAADISTGIKDRGVIIATIGDGDQLIFGSQPKIHVSEESWRSEIKRLALLKPGTKFVAMQLIAAVKAGGLNWE